MPASQTVDLQHNAPGIEPDHFVQGYPASEKIVAFGDGVDAAYRDLRR
jgi:hypothetical protein